MTRSCGWLGVLALLASLPLGCQSFPDVRPPPQDGAGCAPWQPSGAAWSSLATSRPMNLGSLTVSADGQFLYGVGSWYEAGELTTGIFRSQDLGTSWCLLPMPEERRLFGVSASPVSPGHLYATGWLDDSGAVQLVKTADGGATWTVANLPGQNEANLALSATDPNVLSALGVGSAPWVSKDAGESWSRIPMPADIAHDFFFRVIIDPATPDRIAIDGLAATHHTFVTTDAGATWQQSFPPLRDSNSLLTGMTAGPKSSLVAWAFGSLVVSTDWGESWSEAGLLPELDALPFASSSDALYVRLPPDQGSALWRSVDGGATFEPLPLPDEQFEPLVLGAPSIDTIIGQVTGGFTASTDAGQSWSQRPLVPSPLVLNQSPVEPWPIWSVAPDARSTDDGISWAPVAIPSQVVPDGMHADAAFAIWGHRQLQRTEDGGKTWQIVTTPEDVLDIHGIASCRAPRPCLYVLYGRADRPTAGSAYASNLVLSVDGGKTWAESFPVPSELALYYPNALAVSPDNPEQLVASGGLGLAETSDAGRSWTTRAIANAGAIGSIVLFPGGERLAASNNLGVPEDAVYRSADDGATWTKVSNRYGKLFASRAQPDTILLFGSSVSRSTDRGATWSVISPEREFLNPFSAVVDRQDGRFMANMDQIGFIVFD